MSNQNNIKKNTITLLTTNLQNYYFKRENVRLQTLRTERNYTYLLQMWTKPKIILSFIALMKSQKIEFRPWNCTITIIFILFNKLFKEKIFMTSLKSRVIAWAG